VLVPEESVSFSCSVTLKADIDAILLSLTLRFSLAMDNKELRNAVSSRLKSIVSVSLAGTVTNFVGTDFFERFKERGLPCPASTLEVFLFLAVPGVTSSPSAQDLRFFRASGISALWTSPR
jgi:hypothetical protein